MGHRSNPTRDVEVSGAGKLFFFFSIGIEN